MNGVLFLRREIDNAITKLPACFLLVLLKSKLVESTSSSSSPSSSLFLLVIFSRSAEINLLVATPFCKYGERRTTKEVVPIIFSRVSFVYYFMHCVTTTVHGDHSVGVAVTLFGSRPRQHQQNDVSTNMTTTMGIFLILSSVSTRTYLLSWY